MRSAAFRVTIGALAWIALGAAAFLLFRSEQHLTARAAALRTFDDHAREATDALVEARIAQQAYVSAGQGIGFWMPKVTARLEAADTAVAALKASATATTPALDEAASAIKEFGEIEKRVREYLKTSQQLMAADVIFTEGGETASTAGRHIEDARRAEHAAADAAVAETRKQEAMILGGAAGLTALIVLLLVPAARARDEATPSLSIADVPAATQVRPAPKESTTTTAKPAPAVASAQVQTLKAAATLATEFGRVRDLDDLSKMLGRAADAMDASGVMVWMGSTTGADLRAVLAHGYPPEMLARIPPVAKSADNAAAAAYRSGTMQIVMARPGTATGAVVAPILVADGCIGALSAEIRHGGEASEATQALAAILAAQLANVLGAAPAAEAVEPKAAAQA